MVISHSYVGLPEGTHFSTCQRINVMRMTHMCRIVHTFFTFSWMTSWWTPKALAFWCPLQPRAVVFAAFLAHPEAASRPWAKQGYKQSPNLPFLWVVHNIHPYGWFMTLTNHTQTPRFAQAQNSINTCKYQGILYDVKQREECYVQLCCSGVSQNMLLLHII